MPTIRVDLFEGRTVEQKRAFVEAVTQVVVDPEDPAFQNPTKPIGKFLTKEEAEAVAAKTGYLIKEDAGRGYRRFVASPKPIDIVETPSIETLCAAGTIVICCGGGGMSNDRRQIFTCSAPCLAAVAALSRPVSPP